jgi:hypothetical protein
LPRLISLSLRPTAHHRHFQLTCVRSFTLISQSFNLAMGRSRGFGSIARYLVALFRLAFATPSFHKNLSLQHTITRRSIKQKVRRYPFMPEDMHRASTACRFIISGSISLPSTGFFSTFPHGTCPLLVRLEYLVLAHGRAGFLQDFPCPAVLGIPLECLEILHTGLSPSLVHFSKCFYYPLTIPH